MQKKEDYRIDNLKEGFTLVCFSILLGGLIGSIFYYYPHPVNGSILIKNEKVK